MKIDKNEVAARMLRFETVCRDKGIKLTQQRKEIFREVAQTGDHPDADQVFHRVRTRVPTVSLDTVYRTLWLLKDLGMVDTLSSNRERTRFDANLKNHHHFVCSECGFTGDFYCDDLENLRIPDLVGFYGKIEATHLEVRGVCRECAEKRK
ncbi:MAG: Fur family transcriptional regulator [Desulfopila sp.]|jgi:Fur family peroxide stress response transcriptional regulator|nr:Fur family transcriptional regulator [Desulfopila sp.]